ncbi:hypothetical protein FA15DRAFT_660501 [Coprinopsis marcescibilis]|uniref:Uncharacterized protein n=1 Tax=Coprinopsis marcescibilis TaxID=230819 RepID=A0A5C3KF75_COPMA|nr:hypothetical protein FA15DRAFT_660501 [Coprinopsis marcescibilis]
MVTKAKFAVGRVMAPDAELYALCVAIIQMLRFDDCNMIVIFTNHIVAAKRAVDPSVHSGQGHSLAVCAKLSKWFSGGPEHSIEFVQVPSKIGWHIHLAAHDYVRDTPAVSGHRLETSLDSVRQAVAKSSVDSWISEFQHTSYRGKHFLQMRDMQDWPLKPSVLKGGTWLSFTATESIVTTARMVRCILVHALLGEYQAQFNIDGEIQSSRSMVKLILPDAWGNSWTFFRRTLGYLPLKPLLRVSDDFVGGPEAPVRPEGFFVGSSMLQCGSLLARRPNGGVRTGGRLQTKGIGAGVWIPCTAPLAPVGLPTNDNTLAAPASMEHSGPSSRGRLVYQMVGGDPLLSSPMA